MSSLVIGVKDHMYLNPGTCINPTIHQAAVVDAGVGVIQSLVVSVIIVVVAAALLAGRLAEAL